MSSVRLGPKLGRTTRLRIARQERERMLCQSPGSPAMLCALGTSRVRPFGNFSRSLSGRKSSPSLAVSPPTTSRDQRRRPLDVLSRLRRGRERVKSYRNDDRRRPYCLLGALLRNLDLNHDALLFSRSECCFFADRGF